ncbi:hypothetical protein ACWGHM_15085 [Streptomyces sp. NPDC054904]|uniref:hypothetical protein n=1 Tax=Streptomyces sp. NPDC090054 TaxID=3365933 RepID=UPI00381043BE
MRHRATIEGRIVALLTASVALVPWCMGSVDPDEPPGAYRNERERGGVPPGS